MKKILAIIMVVAMVCAASVSVSAATVTSIPDNSNTADVSVAFVNGENGKITTVETVYYVDVTFGDLSLEWKASNADSTNGLVWDPKAHKYVNAEQNGTEISWTVPGVVDDAVAIKNHSNAAVNVSAAFEDGNTATANGLTVTLNTNDNLDLESADTYAYGEFNNADSATYSLTSSGTRPTDPKDVSFEIGTITVTISAE